MYVWYCICVHVCMALSLCTCMYGIEFVYMYVWYSVCVHVCMVFSLCTCMYGVEFVSYDQLSGYLSI